MAKFRGKAFLGERSEGRGVFRVEGRGARYEGFLGVRSGKWRRSREIGCVMYRSYAAQLTFNIIETLWPRAPPARLP